MKLRRVTVRSIIWVAALMISCAGFIIGGAVQYSQASDVCASLSATLQGESCVSRMGDGSTSTLDESSEISGDHIGGITLMVVGVLGATFSLVMAFSMWNFLSDQKLARAVEAESELEAEPEPEPKA